MLISVCFNIRKGIGDSLNSDEFYANDVSILPMRVHHYGRNILNVGVILQWQTHSQTYICFVISIIHYIGGREEIR